MDDDAMQQLLVLEPGFAARILKKLIEERPTERRALLSTVRANAPIIYAEWLLLTPADTKLA